MEIRNSARILTSISTQESMFLSLGQMSEKLLSDLTRIEKSKPAYHISTGVKTGIKLCRLAEKIGLDMSNLLVKSRERLADLREEHATSEVTYERSCVGELVPITASAHMLQLCSTLINRASENLCQAQLLVLGAALRPGSGTSASGGCVYLPEQSTLHEQFNQLQQLTMSYAHDLAQYGETIDTYNQVQSTDLYEMRAQKSALRLIRTYACSVMESAIGLADIALGHLDLAGAMVFAARKDQVEWLAAYATVAGILARHTADLVRESIASLGIVAFSATIHTSDAWPKDDSHHRAFSDMALTALLSRQSHPDFN